MFVNNIKVAAQKCAASFAATCLALDGDAGMRNVGCLPKSVIFGGNVIISIVIASQLVGKQP